MQPPSARHGILGALGARAFGTLAARIGFFVFAATLTSALAVAGTSAQALRGQLRAKAEQRIPAAASNLRDRLELWYAQRVLDVEVFARSATVVEGLSRIAARRDDARARKDVALYLGYVLEGLPLYGAIFVLDASGEPVLGVGAVPTLDLEVRRRVAAASEVGVSQVLRAADGRELQTVTSPVRSGGGPGSFTLHATVPLARLREQLSGAVESGSGRTLLFDASGGFIAASRDVPLSARAMHASLAGLEPGSVGDYVAGDGARVVGSALELPRLRWALVVEEDYEQTFAPMASILRRTVAVNLCIGLVLSALAVCVVTALVRPLRTLSECALRLRDGESGVEIPVVASGDEVGVLARSFREMVDSLTRANETLEQLAITDGLTKIHNHRFFQDQLAREIRRCERTGAPLALVMLDLDDFKAINDLHGHAVGDAVLERIAATLAGITRDSDLVARYGGEEFAILAPETDADAALALAEKARMAVAAMRFEPSLGAASFSVTVSAGVALYRGDRRSFFLDADRALYAAKRAGKDCVVAAPELPPAA